MLHNDASAGHNYAMRTTLEIDDKLLRAAKKAAAQRGVPLRRIVEESLALALSPRSRERRTEVPLRWTVTQGPAAPGVDFTDRDRLYEMMDGRE